jgi:large subunit ribosomal protein L24
VLRIRRGDTVEVVSGDERGARGIVQRVFPKDNRVVIQAVNVVKKHQRPVQAGRGQVQAGIIEFEAPIHASNVMLVCSSCQERTRVGYEVQEDGTKTRICKECGSEID